MNYPNPFYNETQIIFHLINAGKTELAIYNMSGQKIRTLINSFYTSGRHSVVWDGKNNLGKSVGSGIYFYKIRVNSKSEAVNKCLLLK
jgi:flagellar hook assembly protein FlgD